MPKILSAKDISKLHRAYLECGNINETAKLCNRHYQTVKVLVVSGEWEADRQAMIEKVEAKGSLTVEKRVEENLGMVRSVKEKIYKKIGESAVLPSVSQLEALIRLELEIIGKLKPEGPGNGAQPIVNIGISLKDLGNAELTGKLNDAYSRLNSRR